MESAALNKIMALAFLFLGLTILFWLLSMLFSITALMTPFIICGFISVVLIIISAVFIWVETKEEG